MSNTQRLARDQADGAGESMEANGDEAQPFAAPKAALELARDRVARRLGAGRTSLPPDLGGGLFALPAQPVTDTATSHHVGAARTVAPKSFVASFGDTPERRANLPFLPPGISARAQALTDQFDALFLRHAGSNDRRRDNAGMPIEGRNYPNLVALRTKWNELAQTALRMGELYRIQADADPSQHSRELLSESLTRWDQQARQFEAAVDRYPGDDPARIAEERERWSVIQSLGRRLRQASELAAIPGERPMAPHGTAEERQLATAQHRIAILDQQAHEAAVAEIVDRHRALHMRSDEPPSDELIREYETALAAQRWRQPERARHAQLIGDLQAPVTELEARRCRRQAAEVRATADALRFSGGKVSGRRRRDWLEERLARLGFGTRFGQSLPKLDRWIQQHFTTISVLALRKGRTYLRERVVSLARLSALTVVHLQDVTRHLEALARAYEEASESLLEATRHHEDAVYRAREVVIDIDERSGTSARLLAQGYDFRSSFPTVLRGVREDNPDSKLSDAAWIAALHDVWTSALQSAQREIDSNTRAIANPVNPKTGRKLRKLDAHSERHYRNGLDSAKRTLERVLVDYRGRFGVEAARRFSNRLEWHGVSAVRDLPMNALAAPEAAHRARLFEWAHRYVQMWLYRADLSQDSKRRTKTERGAEGNALLQGLRDQARAEQALAEEKFRDEHGSEALDRLLQELREGLAVRDCKLTPALPSAGNTSQPMLTVDAVAPTEHVNPSRSAPLPTPLARETAEAHDELGAPDVPSKETRSVAPQSELREVVDTIVLDGPETSARSTETQSAQPCAAERSQSSASSTDCRASPSDETPETLSGTAEDITWNTAIPDKSGVRQFTLLIRASEDERFEKRRRGRGAGGQLEWRRALSIPLMLEVWLERMRRVLADGVARTFNRIILEASEGKFTADIAAGKAPESVLWEMLHRGELEWANHPGGYVIWRTRAVAAASAGQTMVAHAVCLPSPALPAAAPQEAVQESLTTVRHVFASGMTRPVDMAGAIEAAHPFGVDVGLLSARGRAGVTRAVTADVPVFVDSGAFRLFRENLGLTAAQKGQLAFIAGCGKGLNDDEVIKRYVGLVSDLGKNPSVDLEHLYLVAPDVVGNATDTLRLLRKHQLVLSGFLDVGVSLIVPVQRDPEYGFVEMAMSAVQILARANVSPILGIPTHECAMQEADLEGSLARLRPARIHLLGSAAAQTAGRRLQTIRQHNDETVVTMDGNLLRSRLDEIAGLSGEARSNAIARMLVEATAGKQEVTAQAFVRGSESHVSAPPTRSNTTHQSQVIPERSAVHGGVEAVPEQRVQKPESAQEPPAGRRMRVRQCLPRSPR